MRIATSQSSRCVWVYVVLLLFGVVTLWNGWNYFRATPQSTFPSDGSREKMTIVIVDAGKVEPGTVYRKDVLLKNSSKGEWNVLRTEATCGCLVTEVSPHTIPASTSFTASIKLSVPEEEGPVDKTVIVRLTGANAQPIAIRVTGTARNKLHVSPRSLNLGRVRRQTVSTFDFVVDVPSLEYGRHIECMPSDKQVSVKVVGVEATVGGQAQVKYEGRLDVPADDPLGPKSLLLRLRNSTDKSINVGIPFQYIVSTPLEVVPSRLVFRLKSGIATQKVVIVPGVEVRQSELALPIRGVCESNRFAVSVQKDEGGSYVYDVCLKAECLESTSARIIEDNLTISITGSDDKQYCTVVPVVIHVDQ